MRLLLIRHGETALNAERRYMGHAPTPLNTTGREQARLVGERLARLGAAALYTSDLPRAAETAAIIGATADLTPQPMAGLREIDVGHWYGLNVAEIAAQHQENYAEYLREPAATVRIGGESYTQLQIRAVAAIAAIAARHQIGETLLVVSHGGTIRTLLCHALGLELRHFQRLWIDNAAISELVLAGTTADDEWRAMRYNDTAHLDGMALASGE